MLYHFKNLREKIMSERKELANQLLFTVTLLTVISVSSFGLVQLLTSDKFVEYFKWLNNVPF